MVKMNEYSAACQRIGIIARAEAIAYFTFLRLDSAAEKSPKALFRYAPLIFTACLLFGVLYPFVIYQRFF